MDKPDAKRLRCAMPEILALHSVRVVARRTGLTPDLLRAWERRYQVVQPQRSAGGQRKYSDADIERLRLLVKATAAGRAIGQVAALGDDELQALVAGDQRADAAPDGDSPNPVIAASLQAALDAAADFDAARLESTLRAAALQLPSDEALEKVFGPLLLEIGAGWEEGRYPPANGHLATSTIRRVLTWMSESPTVFDDAPTIVIGTPAMQLHDLGAMLAATVAATSGCRVAFLGASLPAIELARAARMARADTVALSIVQPSDHPRVSGELRQLRSELPRSVALIVGGAGPAAHADVLDEIGAQRLESLASLRAWLAARAQGGEQRASGTPAAVRAGGSKP
jgi:DNA-binding transcriptional MerR regulator/methylmalonyl-CoA mutase cobalamin-binding subunit